MKCRISKFAYAFVLLAPFLHSNAQSAGTPDSNVGTPASDVGVAASDVGVAASDVGVAASDVGTAATEALPPYFSTDNMTYHVAGQTVVQATDIKITSPVASTHWTSNATNTVSWTGTTPARFSIQLINDDTSIRASGVSLRASVDVTAGSATCDTPKLKVDSGYYLRFYDQLDISKTIAVSDKFTIDNTITAAAPSTIANTTANEATTDNSTSTAKTNAEKNAGSSVKVSLSHLSAAMATTAGFVAVSLLTVL